MRLKRLFPRGLRNVLDLRRRPIDLFVEREAPKVAANSLVVDVGCGECNYKKRFAHTRYVGVDLAVGNAGWDYAKIDVLADLTRIPMRDSVADVVLCTETLEHLERPWRFAEEAARILKPGGRLLLTVPHISRMHQVPYDFFRYTEWGLKSLFMRHGLTVARLDHEGGYFIVLGDILKHFSGHLFRASWARWVFFPLYMLTSVACGLVIPLLCLALDGLDRKRRFTIGFTGVFVKAAAPTP